MNLADYLSELLGLHDEVNVPGLGYFIRNRVSAFYNDAEGRFYPPYHQVKFVPQPKDDDTFAQYVADKKNISLASSKYFVEKFITKLREDASKGKYLFADLGSFQSDLGQLVFKPNERILADPEFYGFPPVAIFKAATPLPVEVMRPALAPVPDQPAPTPAPPAADMPPPPRGIHAPEYYEEEVEQKKRVNVWLIILVALALLGLVAFGVYKFYPQAFDKVKDEYNKLNGKQPDTPAVIHKQVQPVKKDTVTKSQPDSATKAVTPVAKPDTANMPHYEAVVREYLNWAAAEAKVANLKKLGYTAYIPTDLPGNLIKVSVGKYLTYAAADSAINSLVKAGIIKTKTKELPIKANPQ